MHANCLITATHYNRPEYTRASLASLARCEGIADCTYLAHAEPGCDEVIAALRAIDFCAAEVVVNPRRLGCDRNTVAALDAGFARCDFVVHVEDDVLLAPDALLYAWWARAAYCGDPAVAAVSIYHRVYDAPHPALYHDVRRRVWFHPWGWGTWRDRWEGTLRPAATSGRGWDTSIGRRVVAAGLHEVYPALSRAQNIGAASSIHPPGGFFTPEWHRREQHCPHWAGDGRLVHPGTFREVPG